MGEALLKELECPVCLDYMVPPIKLCANGHNICSKCRERVSWCPTCRAQFSEIRNVALENIARSQKYPCANRKRGCLETLSIEHIAEHYAACVYGNIKCPLQIIGTCSWNGLKSDLKKHTIVAHPRYLIELPTLISPQLSGILGILSCFGELFTYYQQMKDGALYGAVQLIGTSSEASKYKCEYTLRAANGIDQISKTFLVRSSTEDWETSFNSGKCLRLDEVTARNFLVENKLKLAVKVSRV
jgi:E3 ubiquitin-protein ligase SIAH1